MQFSPASLIAIAPQLASYLKQAVDHYAALRAAGKDASVVVIAAYLAEKMADWNPKVGSVELLDPETRQAASRFLAGVAVNIASA
jgi:hypothetical protein